MAYLRIKNIPPHPELNSLGKVIDASKNNQTVENASSSSILRIRRAERGAGMECGIMSKQNASCQAMALYLRCQMLWLENSNADSVLQPRSSLPTWIDYVEAPVHLFSHLIPAGMKTVPVVHLNKQLIGGYDSLCNYLEVEDIINNMK